MGNRKGKEREEKIVFTAIYTVKRSDELLNFLLVKCNTSRNNVKNLLSHKQVLVNGSVVSQFNFPLAKDDEVKISKNPIKDAPTKHVPKAKRQYVTLPIIYEDTDFIAVDKPYGLLAVESDNERLETAYNYVLEYLQQYNKQARPFIVHRIDKETSGVLIFAKNIKVHSQLKLKWNELVTKREYIAIVEGHMSKESDRIVNYLDINHSNNLMFVTKDNTKQLAITNYKVIKKANLYDMLLVDIETGKKNQIRVTLDNLGHPIIGDTKYGVASDPLKRLGLHASCVEFKHPFTDQIITIKSKTPTIFSNLFLNVRK